MNLPREEIKTIVGQAQNPDWWVDDWEYEQNKKCPSCNMDNSVSSKTIDTSAGKKKLYYCDECGFVWSP